MKFLKWNIDKWLSTQGSIFKYDKLEHLLLSIVGTTIIWFLNLGFINLFLDTSKLSVINFALYSTFIISVFIGFVWEIKDGTKPYDSDGNIQGFSFKDLISDTIGTIISIILLKYFLYIALILSFIIMPVLFLIVNNRRMSYMAKNYEFNKNDNK